jgi:hypothetical protein
MKEKNNFAARFAAFQRLPLATLLPQAVALRLRDAACAGAFETPDLVSRRIDAVILEVDAREPGKYWQHEQIAFLSNPYAFGTSLLRKRGAPTKVRKDDEASFTSDDAAELARLSALSLDRGH